MCNLRYEWDEVNIAHIAEHDVQPQEAEQVIANRPVDLASELRSGEKRDVSLGETDSGRALVVISTMSGDRIRVVTAWPANKNYRRYFASLKRNGNVGRTEEQDLRE